MPSEGQNNSSLVGNSVIEKSDHFIKDLINETKENSEKKPKAEDENGKQVSRQLRRVIDELPVEEKLLSYNYELLKERFRNAGFDEVVDGIDFRTFPIYDLLKAKEIFEDLAVDVPDIIEKKEFKIYLDRINHSIQKKGEGIPEIASNVEKKIAGSEPGSQIEEISPEEIDKIFKEIEIHGEAFNGQRLTPEILKKEGLLPKYKVSTDKSVIWFSSSGYSLGSDRIAVMAYVEKDKKTVARSYYLSNSQGVWRYLPSALTIDGKIDWYDKGYGEESVTLPSHIQRALAEITKDEKTVKHVQNPELIFVGASRGFMNANIKGTYIHEIESTPVKLGNFSLENKNKKIAPEDIRLSEEQSPNFNPEKSLNKWRQNSKIYGEIEMESLPSMDGKLIFTFCKDRLGRVWIGNIENDSETQSTGLKREWIDPQDLGTPAYEYKIGRTDQTGGYGNDKLRNGSYVDMFEKYLSQIPVIREYCLSRSIPLPQLIDERKEAIRTLEITIRNSMKTLEENAKIRVALQKELEALERVNNL